MLISLNLVKKVKRFKKLNPLKNKFRLFRRIKELLWDGKPGKTKMEPYPTFFLLSFNDYANKSYVFILILMLEVFNELYFRVGYFPI